MSSDRTEDIPHASPGVKRRVTIFMLLAGGILWIPLSRKLLGTDVVFLRDLGSPPGTWLAWLLALGGAAIYSVYAIRNGPPVMQTWWRPDLLKLLAIIVSIAAAIVEEAFFRRFIMDRVLGHLEPGVGARYDRHDYLHEKNAALNAWAASLEEILSGEKSAENVVELHAG